MNNANPFFSSLFGAINTLGQARQRKLQEDLLKQRIANLPTQLAQQQALQQARLGMLGAQTGLLQEREKLLPQQQLALEQMNKQRMAQMQAMAQLAQARAQGLPQQQQLEQQLKRAQISALTGKGQVIGVDAHGLPIMSMQGAAGTQMQPSGLPQPSAQNIGGMPSPQQMMPSAPSAQQQQPASQINAFLPSQIGKTKTGPAVWRNPYTRESISALTSQGRTMKQQQYAAIQRLIPILQDIKKYGTQGTFGAPTVIGQDIIGGNPLAAAIYNQKIQQVRELYPAAVGIKNTVPAQDAAEKLYRRPEGLASPLYSDFIDKSINNFIEKLPRIKTELIANGINVKDDVPHGQMFPDFGNDASKQKAWYLKQSDAVRKQYRDYLRSYENAASNR